MMAYFKAMLEYRNGEYAILPRSTKTITALRTVENGEGIMDHQ